MQEWLMENWRYVAAGAAALGLFGGGKIKSILLSLKNRVFKGKALKEEGVCPETADQTSLKHLRVRASGNKELLELIKGIDAKFFDMHCAGDDAPDTSAE